MDPNSIFYLIPLLPQQVDGTNASNFLQNSLASLSINQMANSSAVASENSAITLTNPTNSPTLELPDIQENGANMQEIFQKSLERYLSSNMGSNLTSTQQNLSATTLPTPPGTSPPQENPKFIFTRPDTPIYQHKKIRRQRPLTSPIWQYADLIEKGYAKCKVCGVVKKTHGGTTTLLFHFKMSHKDIFEKEFGENLRPKKKRLWKAPEIKKEEPQVLTSGQDFFKKNFEDLLQSSLMPSNFNFVARPIPLSEERMMDSKSFEKRTDLSFDKTIHNNRPMVSSTSIRSPRLEFTSVISVNIPPHNAMCNKQLTCSPTSKFCHCSCHI